MRADAWAAVLFLALAGAVPAGTAAGSSQQEGAQPQNMRFAGMDRNRDGVITRDEWRGSAESFRVHDWNDDGVLAGAEVRPGGRAANRRARDYEPAAPPEIDDWSEEHFTELDHDDDGRLTAGEWHFDREAFRRADRNRDGVVTRSEFMGDAMDDDREDRFRDLDVDRSGRIEEDEWHGSADAFEWLDRDRDGVLSRTEVVGDEPAEDEDLFRSLDVNRNGLIARNEWHWSRRSFDQRDADRNGALTPEEFGGSRAAVGTSGSMREVTVDPSVRWTETGVLVRAGDVIRIEADGTVQLSTNDADVAEPKGARSGRRAADAPLKAYPAGALIARVGESGPVHVGAGSTLRAPAGGELFLGVNDDHLPDNRGAFRVRISVPERGR